MMKIRRVFCLHEKILEDRCQYCLQQIEFQERQEFNRYLFQLDGISSSSTLVKGSALLKQEQEYIDTIISRQKVILILDLDNTILHSTEMS